MYKINLIIYLFILTTLTIVSCKNKDDISPIAGAIKMRVDFQSGIMTEDEPLATKSSIREKSSSIQITHTQTQTISLGKDISLIAELIPETSSENNIKISNEPKQKAAAVLTKNSLAIGTKYRLLVYNSLGMEIKRIDKEVTSSSSAFDEFTLDATGITTTYTFVAYSAGTANLPALSANSTLSSALIDINNQKLMHYVSAPLALNYGENNLNVTLVNKLTEITTEVDGSAIGLNKIKGLGSVVFEGATRTGGSLKLSNGTLTYTGNLVNKAIAFPAFTASTSVTGIPTVLLNAGTTSAKIKIDYIDIDGYGHSAPIEVTGISIQPGVKYKLNLKLRTGNCMTNVDPQSFSMNKDVAAGCKVWLGLTEYLAIHWWNLSLNQSQCVNPGFGLLFGRTWVSNLNIPNGSTIGQTFEFSTLANNGVVINITSLDNSFNMAINDTEPGQNTPANQLATKEIQFQLNKSPNIEFTDNSQYGVGTVSEVYNITNGTYQNPVIRVTISATGIVSMEGRKNNSDLTLYPLRPKSTGTNAFTFNNVTWKTTGSTTNTVTISQTVDGPTNIAGQVTGKRLAPCN